MLAVAPRVINDIGCRLDQLWKLQFFIYNVIVEKMLLHLAFGRIAKQRSDAEEELRKHSAEDDKIYPANTSIGCSSARAAPRSAWKAMAGLQRAGTPPGLEQWSSRGVVVVKVGTSSLIRGDVLHLSRIAALVEAVRDIRQSGLHVVIVSSGAVGAGSTTLSLHSRKGHLSEKQALASVGMVRLMRTYDDLFNAAGITCSQVLLTLENLIDKTQYENAKNTLSELLHFNVVPIVNENDTVAVQELKFGDNDSLSAQVAALVGASMLLLLTDVDGLYTDNPYREPNAQLIQTVESVSNLNADISSSGSSFGTGGMESKLAAARVASTVGCSTIIMSSDRMNEIVLWATKCAGTGTLVKPSDKPVRGRERWILALPPRGDLRIDSGATAAVEQRRKSLFAAGVVACHGDFDHNDAVKIVADDEPSGGREIGRGLMNYSADEMRQIIGLQSQSVYDVLGYRGPEAVISRQNICLWNKPIDPEHNEDDLSVASGRGLEAADHGR